jgi:hypothetical protein
MKIRHSARAAIAFWAIQTLFAAELPVRQVVLYKHGVGYFERSGSLAAGDSARLEFKAAEMNDVLKSLSITENGGAKVAGIRYSSSIPLEQQLAEFPFHLEPGQALSAILDQLRGARLELQFGTEKISGIIVGARAVPATPAPAPVPGKEQITLLLDTGDLKTYDLAAAASLRFSDAKLQAQFREYLQAVAGSRSADKRILFIDSVGATAPREIHASYIVPSPVWKSSYRLILSETAPLLEGWAIVDNTTGEDWTNVRMSLVSGKPISFISQLYEPKYIARLTADLPEDQPVKPPVFAASMAAPAAMNGALDGAPQQFNRLEQFAKLQKPPVVEYEPSTIVAQALAQERGDLFEYTIATPVTVRKNESAMLPFLQGKIEARRLLIYSNEASSHPIQAAELNNTTGKTLDGGPITVFDAGTYAGEALVETVKAGSKRLIGYAVDLGTSITTAFETKSAITREIHFTHGALLQKIASAETKTYTASNADAKAKTLVIEHAKRPGYELLSPKPSETTPTGYRFEITLPNKGTAKVTVSEERVYETSLTISNLRNDQIGVFLQNKSLSSAARQALNSILTAKNKIADLDRQLSTQNAQIESLNNDARRIRDNIGTLNAVSGQQTQVQTYAARLASLETEITAAANSRKLLLQQRADAQAALDTQIATLEF